MNVFERLLPRVGDTMLGRFRLESELGRGGFGVVYKANQTSLNQPVAIKVLLPHILSNQELVDRFTREVAVARDLQHPNTIRILDYDRTPEGIPFYVMEFVTGDPLNDAIRQGAMPEARAKRIVTQTLKSLAEAHAAGVIHRDLKPANIMLCDIYGERDYVKVLDFGIAKALTGVEGHTTKTGMLLGSPPYMSPEQARAVKDLDHRSDLYSVGLILAECLTGIPVVQIAELGQVLALHLSDEPLPFAPRVLNSPLWPVVQKATQKDRSHRYRDAAEMREHLESIEVGQGYAPAATAGGQPHQAGPPPTPSAVYGTPPPSQVHSSHAQFTPPPSQVSSSPGGATPPPSGQSQPGTPYPTAPSGQFTSDPTPANPDHGRLFVAGATIADSSATSKAKKKSRAPLFIFILLLLGGGGAAFFAIGPGSGSGDTSGESATAPTDDDARGGVADDENEAETTDDGNVGPVAVVTHTDPEPTDEGRMTATAGISIAQSEVHAGLPSLHQIRFSGMSDVTVRYGDVVLGVTPFPMQVPNALRDVALTFEREGYRTEQMTVNLARRDPIAIDLRRDRRQQPEEDDHDHDHAAGDDSSQDDGPVADQEVEEEDQTPGFVIPEVTIH